MKGYKYLTKTMKTKAWWSGRIINLSICGMRLKTEGNPDSGTWPSPPGTVQACRSSTRQNGSWKQTSPRILFLFLSSPWPPEYSPCVRHHTFAFQPNCKFSKVRDCSPIYFYSSHIQFMKKESISHFLYNYYHLCLCAESSPTNRNSKVNEWMNERMALWFHKMQNEVLDHLWSV